MDGDVAIAESGGLKEVAEMIECGGYASLYVVATALVNAIGHIRQLRTELDKLHSEVHWDDPTV